MNGQLPLAIQLKRIHSAETADLVEGLIWLVHGEMTQCASHSLDLPHCHGVTLEIRIAHRHARSHIPYSQPVVFTRGRNSADIVFVPVAAEHLGRASLGAVSEPILVL
jgi:hypothetical protein